MAGGIIFEAMKVLDCKCADVVPRGLERSLIASEKPARPFVARGFKCAT
jgi:hypothetical protein